MTEKKRMPRYYCKKCGKDHDPKSKLFAEHIFRIEIRWRKDA